MKYVLIFVLVLSILSVNSVYGHKLISHDNSHTNIENALNIPDHKISWAIYEDLNTNQAKFYSFDAEAGDSFYASIVIPKITELDDYSPTLILLTPESNDGSSQFTQQKFLYEGNFPGFEFYEPFGQVTYWERQEVNLVLPVSGTYIIVVTDEKNQQGKYSLAIGTIEDFTGGDIFLLLPKSWIDTKLFVGDYVSLGILFLFVILPFVILVLLIVRKNQNKKFGSE